MNTFIFKRILPCVLFYGSRDHIQQLRDPYQSRSYIDQKLENHKTKHLTNLCERNMCNNLRVSFEIRDYEIQCNVIYVYLSVFRPTVNIF